jgi:hypothetical protein
MDRIKEVQDQFECSDDEANNILTNIFNQSHLSETINDLIDIEVEYILNDAQE